MPTQALDHIEESLASGRYRQDPYPLYAKLRERAPIYWSEAWNAWLITRHEDVKGILLDPVRFSNERRLEHMLDPLPEEARRQAKPVIERYQGGIQHSDPPHHTRISKLIIKAFTPKVVEGMHNLIQGCIDDLLDGVIDRGRMDVVGEFAMILPAKVIGHVLGFTQEECERFRHWDDAIVALTSCRTSRPDLVENARAAAEEQAAWMADVAERRRQCPGEDLFSILVQGLDQGVLRDWRDLTGSYLAILIGGHETTTGLISSALNLLLRNPDQLQMLQEKPDLISSAVEEALRFESPIQFPSRVSKQAVTLRGVTIPPDQSVLPLVGAANRDPEVFENPDRFDITRNSTRHLAFGAGIHFCIGAQLCRMEARLALTTIFRRMTNIRVVENNLLWRPIDIFRILERLQIEFERKG